MLAAQGKLIISGLLPEVYQVIEMVAPDPANLAVWSLGAVSFGEQPSGVLSTKEPQLTMQEFISACKLSRQQQQVTEILRRLVLASRALATVNGNLSRLPNPLMLINKVV
jgi:hypothetical protein